MAHLVNKMDLGHLIVHADLVERLDRAHPDGVRGGKTRREQDRAGRVHFDRAQKVRLEHAKRPVEVRLLQNAAK